MPEARRPAETSSITTPKPGNDQGIPTPTGDIGTEVYRKRRQRVMEQMGSGVAVVFAAETIGSGKRQNSDFYYLTGLAHEAGAALLLAPEHPQHTEQLFLRALDVEDNRWHGIRPMLGRATELGTGIARVMRTAHMPAMLNQAVLQTKSRDLVHLGQFAPHNAPIGKELSLLREVQARILNASIRDEHKILPRMRSVHDEAELKLMQHAIDATIDAYRHAMQGVKPGMNERRLMHIFEHAIHAHDCEGFAYEPIVGSGPNNWVLHYTANTRAMNAGELVLCDVGAQYQMYAADITRTFPVSGTFTPRQRQVHDVVQEAWQTAVDLCKPGITWIELNDAARRVIDKAGFADEYYHSLGHFLGLDVHDAGLSFEPLQEGQVVTIEPGIYIASENLGVRTEDDILITKNGCKVLSKDLPRSASEIEAFMAK